MNYNNIIDTILLTLNNKITLLQHENVFTTLELHHIIGQTTGKPTLSIRNILYMMCETHGYIKYDQLGIFYITELGMNHIKELEDPSTTIKDKDNIYDTDGSPRY